MVTMDGRSCTQGWELLYTVSTHLQIQCCNFKCSILNFMQKKCIILNYTVIQVNSVLTMCTEMLWFPKRNSLKALESNGISSLEGQQYFSKDIKVMFLLLRWTYLGKFLDIEVVCNILFLHSKTLLTSKRE